MFKKLLLLAGVYMLLGTSAVSLAQEEPESTLTPRQLLLLQVPEGVKKAAEFDGWKVTWEPIHDAAWGPSDFIALSKDGQLWIITAIGDKPKMLTLAFAEDGETFLPVLSAYFKNDTLEVVMAFISLKGADEALKTKAERAMNYLSSALEALGLETEDGLVEFIKGLPKTGSKKATPL